MPALRTLAAKTDAPAAGRAAAIAALGKAGVRIYSGEELLK